MGKLILTLQERLTFNYNDEWQHLDRWGKEGQFHILSTSRRFDEDKYGESWQEKVHIKAPISLTKEETSKILYGAFRRTCRCEHDCCGHIQSYVNDVKRIRRREYRVTIRCYVNC